MQNVNGRQKERKICRIKIMLVDVRKEVRTSIIRKMDWEALGFHVVGDAENGERRT